MRAHPMTDNSRPAAKVIQLTNLIEGNGYIATHCLALCDDGSIWYFMPDNDGNRQWMLKYKPKAEDHTRPPWEKDKP